MNRRKQRPAAELAAIVPFEAADPAPAVDLRGDAERTAEVEADAAERASLRADEAAELAAELAELDPVATVDRLGARWSPDLDAYAAGQLDAAAVRCVLCGHAPCDCPPFGSAAYLEMLDRVHGRTR